MYLEQKRAYDIPQTASLISLQFEFLSPQLKEQADPSVETGRKRYTAPCGSRSPNTAFSLLDYFI
jgi:hypothetical protein